MPFWVLGEHSGDISIMGGRHSLVRLRVTLDLSAKKDYIYFNPREVAIEVFRNSLHIINDFISFPPIYNHRSREILY